MSVVLVKPGRRHSSWPWYLRSGMFVWMSWPDDHDPLGRIAGAVDGGHRDGQPAIVACEDYPPSEDGACEATVACDVTVAHPDFLLPCPPSKRLRAECALNVLFGREEATADA